MRDKPSASFAFLSYRLSFFHVDADKRPMLSAIKILLALLSLFVRRVIGTISLSVPSGNVVVDIIVNCQWTSTISDPSEFDLVTQFGDGVTDDYKFNAVVTTVRRGTTTSGNVAVPNTHVLRIHRLAAFLSPFNSTSPGDPIAVSGSFEVIPGVSSSITVSTTATTTTQSIAISSTRSRSSSVSTGIVTGITVATPSSQPQPDPVTAGSSNAAVIGGAVAGACLFLICVATIVILVRRRHRRQLDLLRGIPFDIVQYTRPMSGITVGTDPPPIPISFKQKSGGKTQHIPVRQHPPEGAREDVLADHMLDAALAELAMLRNEMRGLRQELVTPPVYFLDESRR
ncbi:hypothetical protein C8J56DRAFT_976130 [Mycena floridula]|nr:hypothetical protein C8J56DRAFT_976130 [Mycena floridula]